MFDDPHGRAFLLPDIKCKMSNKTQTTPENKIIDLPLELRNGIDAVELGSVRLTACLRSIDRLRELISNKSLFPEGDDNIQDIFNAADEMGLMIEKARSVIDEIYDPSIEAMVHASTFLEAQFSND